MELLLILFEQLIETFKEDYSTPLLVAFIIAIAIILLLKLYHWRWPNKLSISQLKTEQLKNMIGRSRTMRIISAFVPVMSYTLISREPPTDIQSLSVLFLIYAAPLILLTLFLQYKQTLRHVTCFRRILFLIPGLISNVLACLIWVSFFYSFVPLMVALIMLYFFLPVFIEAWIFALTEEKESKKITIYTSNGETIEVPLIDYKILKDHVYIRRRDRNTGEIVSVQKFPMDQIQKTEVSGIDVISPTSPSQSDPRL